MTSDADCPDINEPPRRVYGPERVGFDVMASTMEESGLAAPWVPATLMPALRQTESWLWTTQEYGPTRVDDYLMKSAELLEGVVEDHIAVSHGGHGISSYAVTWRMVWGPLALVVQGGWGGVYTDSSAARRLAELFDRVTGLAKIADARVEECHAVEREKWVRPVRIAISPMRRIFVCDMWNPRTGARDKVELERDPWTTIAGRISECAIAEPWIWNAPLIGEAEDKR